MGVLLLLLSFRRTNKYETKSYLAQIYLYHRIKIVSTKINRFYSNNDQIVSILLEA